MHAYFFLILSMGNRVDQKSTACFRVKTAWHAIFRMYNTLGLEKGISSSTGFLLLNVPREGVAVTHLGPLLGLSARSLSRSLNGLESKGWIERRLDPQDKRMMRVFLTPQGLRFRRDASQTVKAFQKFLMAKWSPEQWQLIQNMLEHLPKLAAEFVDQNTKPAINTKKIKSLEHEMAVEN